MNVPMFDLDFFRRLAYSGLLGTGAFGTFFLLRPDLLHGIPWMYTLYLGAFVGAGLHPFIDGILMNNFLRPLSDFGRHYIRLCEFRMARRVLGSAKYRELVTKEIEDLSVKRAG